MVLGIIVGLFLSMSIAAAFFLRKVVIEEKPKWLYEIICIGAKKYEKMDRESKKKGKRNNKPLCSMSVIDEISVSGFFK